MGLSFMFWSINHATLFILEPTATWAWIIAANLLPHFLLWLRLSWLISATGSGTGGSLGDSGFDWSCWGLVAMIVTMCVIMMVLHLDRHLKDSGGNFSL